MYPPIPSGYRNAPVLLLVRFATVLLQLLAKGLDLPPEISLATRYVKGIAEEAQPGDGVHRKEEGEVRLWLSSLLLRHHSAKGVAWGDLAVGWPSRHMGC